MPDQTCAVDGCEKPKDRRARLCHMRQARKKRHGDVNYVTPSLKDPAPRFWSKVEKTDGCWLWRGWTDHDGYGVFSVQHRRTGAHRWAWVLSGRGEVPEGMHLDHLCRVRNCVNPDHLEVVTPRENVLRSYRHRRHATAECDACPFLACPDCRYQPKETP